MKNIFEHEELIGQPVHSLLHGNGFILSVDYNTTLPIECKFGKETYWFTKDGKFLSECDSLPVLSLGHKPFKKFEYGKPVVKPTPLDTDSINWSDANQTKYFIGIQHNSSGSKTFALFSTADQQVVGVDYYTKEAGQKLLKYYEVMNNLN